MAQFQVPEQMTALILDSYSGVDALRLEQRPVPGPGENEVLVKVAASPINPSDLAFLEGQYGFKKPLPVVPGFEGSGTVVAAGAGLVGRYFLGKRVACLSGQKGDGVWADYMLCSTKGGALPLHESVDLEQGAMSVVNPLTACAFLELVKQGRHKAIVLTAAASALGQMLNRLCRSEEVQVINIVHRDAQVELLHQQGATLVFNSSESGFDQQLHDACHQHNAHLALDAVAGPLTLQLLEAMPRHSKVTVYGALSYNAAQASPAHLIFQDKSIDGFWLGPWMAKKNLFQILMVWRRAQRLISNKLKSDVRSRYPLEDAQQAIREYKEQMSGGKILFKMDQS